MISILSLIMNIILASMLNNHLHDLDYADDVCLLTHTHADMQNKLNLIAQQAELIGLQINSNKTKSMRVNTNNQQNFRINNETLEDVEQYCYLGSIITVNGGTEEDIEERIRKARIAFGTLKDT